MIDLKASLWHTAIYISHIYYLRSVRIGMDADEDRTCFAATEYVVEK